MLRASSEKLGAIIISANCLFISSAVSPSTEQLKAIMPPKADVGSVMKALRYASFGLSAIATPQGLACFTITQDDADIFFTHSHAFSASFKLLKDSSFP